MNQKSKLPFIYLCICLLHREVRYLYRRIKVTRRLKSWFIFLQQTTRGDEQLVLKASRSCQDYLARSSRSPVLDRRTEGFFPVLLSVLNPNRIPMKKQVLDRMAKAYRKKCHRIYWIIKSRIRRNRSHFDTLRNVGGQSSLHRGDSANSQWSSDNAQGLQACRFEL